MSNFTAIAAVTATIKQLLLDNITSDVPGANVTSNPPDIFQGQTPGNQLNVFLYQIQLNPNYRNDDVPQRDSNGNIIKLPRIGLNLNYLITSYGDGNDDLLSQQIMASAIRTLHENPILTPTLITSALAATPEIQNSDLPYQIEVIRLAPHPLSFEEITKLWSIFFQTSYRLSFAYLATVVLLDGLSDVQPTLPVITRNLSVYPFSQPYIQTIKPQIVEMKNPTITILGRNLASSTVSVMFDTTEQPVNSSIVNNQITIQVPDIPAGIVSVQIIHKSPIGHGPTPDRTREESNVFPILLLPNITGTQQQMVPQGRQLMVNFIPAARPGQQISLLIGNNILQIPSPMTQTNQVSVIIPDEITSGSSYMLRIRIDNAESKLTQNGTSRPNYNPFNGPRITIQ